MSAEFLTSPYEAELQAIGNKWSKVFRERATAILEEIRKDFPITKMIMGMGVYSLQGNIRYHYLDGVEEDFTTDAEDILEWIARRRYSLYEPLGLTQRHIHILLELNDILQYNTDDRYLALFDWRAQ